MVNLGILTTLEELEQEMAQEGRVREKTALHEALNALVRPERGFLTTGQAAERLGVSIPTIKRWIERDNLAGGQLGGRWVVSQESVDRLVRLRETLRALDEEGNPSPDEVRAMHGRAQDSSVQPQA